MIIDLLNFSRNYPGEEANTLFRLQESGISIPQLFCITENFSEDELNNYLQNHFQHTDRFVIKLDVSYVCNAQNESGMQVVIPDLFSIDKPVENVPKSALSYTAEKIFSDARKILKNSFYDHPAMLKNYTMKIIIREMFDLKIHGNLHTVYKMGLMNESIIYIGEPFDTECSQNNVNYPIYCHNNTDGILFGYEPEGTVKAELSLIKKLLEISEKIVNIMNEPALDIRFSADTAGNKIYIISVSKIYVPYNSSSEITVLDNRGVSKYYPGVTKPLNASISMAMAAKTANHMIQYTGIHKILPHDIANYYAYVNGRLYFNVNKLQKLQDILGLNDDTSEFINFSPKQFIQQLRSFHSISKLRKKRRTAKKTNKLLENNLKHRDQICNKLNIALDSFPSNIKNISAFDIMLHMENVLSALSECMNANQLNTLYINFNQKLIKHFKTIDKKYSRVKRAIAIALSLREELCSYHYSFQRILNTYSLHIGESMVKAGILEKSEDVLMLTFDELNFYIKNINNTVNFSKFNYKSDLEVLTKMYSERIKMTLFLRKKEFEWYRSMPGFSKMEFSLSESNAPIGIIDFICTVTEESHIRGCSLNCTNAEYPAVLCKNNVLPENCSANKIYILNNFDNFSGNANIGGLIVIERPDIMHINPANINLDFPVICGAEHADSIINNGDIVIMNGSTGDINIKHIIQ